MPVRDLTSDRAAMKMLARVKGCPHVSAVPVDSLEGKRVAWLCPDCDGQLPAEWKPPQSYWQPRERERSCPQCELAERRYRNA
jgi:hypothetical protein